VKFSAVRSLFYPDTRALFDVDFVVADPAATGLVMQFRVSRVRSRDTITPPQFLQLPAIAPLPAASATRQLALIEETSEQFEDAPVAATLGTVAGDPNAGPGVRVSRMWMDEVTESPPVGAVETREVYNATADAHPIHIHETTFAVVNRRDIVIDEAKTTG
jgi:spore coat protein A